MFYSQNEDKKFNRLKIKVSRRSGSLPKYYGRMYKKYACITAHSNELQMITSYRTFRSKQKEKAPARNMKF